MGECLSRIQTAPTDCANEQTNCTTILRWCHIYCRYCNSQTNVSHAAGDGRFKSCSVERDRCVLALTLRWKMRFPIWMRAVFYKYESFTK